MIVWISKWTVNNHCLVCVFLFVSYTCPFLVVLTGCSISNLQYLISLLMQFLVSDMKWVIARQNHCWLMHHHICSFVALCLHAFAPTWHNSPYLCAGQNELGTFWLWVAPMDPKGTKLIDCWNVHQGIDAGAAHKYSDVHLQSSFV
jgi:hypothetical protein